MFVIWLINKKSNLQKSENKISQQVKGTSMHASTFVQCFYILLVMLISEEIKWTRIILRIWEHSQMLNPIAVSVVCN